MIHGQDVKEVGEIGVTGEGVTLFAFHQNFYFQNAGDIRGQRLDERRDREFLDQHARTVSIGKGGIDVDDSEAGIDQVNAANVGTGWQRMRRRLVEIESKRARSSSSARCWRTEGSGICAD